MNNSLEKSRHAMVIMVWVIICLKKRSVTYPEMGEGRDEII
jgi:hypothetical protein